MKNHSPQPFDMCLLNLPNNVLNFGFPEDVIEHSESTIPEKDVFYLKTEIKVIKL